MSSEPKPFTPDPYKRRQTVPPSVLKSGLSRRGMLKSMGLVSGAAALGIPSAAAQAEPATTTTAAGRANQLPEGFSGDITDIKHVVILIQENRSFDHYYGAMPGVRGFNDKQALNFPDGTDVFSQPNGSSFVKPTRVSTVAGTTTGLDHSYSGGVKAWSKGKYDGWISAKGPATMHYVTGEEIPWQWSLASAYTICDHWHASLMGPTTPNRLYHFTGTSGGTTGNGHESDGLREWQTYPEVLQEAGVSWRTYVDNSNNGSTWVGDYTDNPVRGFATFTTSGSTATDAANRADSEKNAPGTGLIWRAGSSPYKPTGAPNNDSDENLNAVLKDFIDACKPDAEFPLPQVSWIVAPYGWCEHPSANPEHGAHFSNRVIKALQDNPELWRNTLLIMAFDENDGYFDHVLPPHAEPGTEGEYAGDSPLGYGARVPGILVSPWSRGGWVCSETFDHTSIIQFLEKWTSAIGSPAICSTITNWRRGISGDLTSALDFAHPIFDTPQLPDTDALVQIARAGGTIGPQVPPEDTWDGEALKPRPLSFHPHGTFSEDRASGKVTVDLTLEGTSAKKTVSLQALPDDFEPFSNTPFTVGASSPGHYTWDAASHDGKYAFSIYGPDRFVRSFAGVVLPQGQNNSAVPAAHVTLVSGDERHLEITLRNDGLQTLRYELVANDYEGETTDVWVRPEDSQHISWPVDSDGYYDLIITADSGTGWQHRYAGRICGATS